MRIVLITLALLLASCGRNEIPTPPREQGPGWSPEVQEKGKSCPTGTVIACKPCQVCRCYTPEELQ